MRAIVGIGNLTTGMDSSALDGGVDMDTCRTNQEGVLRQYPPPQRIQDLAKEAFCLHRRLVVESIAVKLGYSRRSDDNAFRIAMLDDVKGEDKGSTEGGGQTVIRWGLKGEQIDLLRGLGADKVAIGIDGDGKEGWDWGHDCELG